VRTANAIGWRVGSFPRQSHNPQIKYFETYEADRNYYEFFRLKINAFLPMHTIERPNARQEKRNCPHDQDVSTMLVNRPMFLPSNASQ
jgi:hypothetical protein